MEKLLSLPAAGKDEVNLSGIILNYHVDDCPLSIK
jgi:hypothetical protein